LVLLALDGWFAWISPHQFYGERETVLGMFAARMSLLVLDVVTLWAVGPWVAVTARHPNQAAANLLMRVCVLPWLVFLALLFSAAIAQEWRWVTWRLDENVALATWFGLGLLSDLCWLAYAASRTDRDLREAAAARFERRGGCGAPLAIQLRRGCRPWGPSCSRPWDSSGGEVAFVGLG
jgi:hypothetical protein